MRHTACPRSGPHRPLSRTRGVRPSVRHQGGRSYRPYGAFRTAVAVPITSTSVIICVECHTQLADEQCPKCRWAPVTRDGVDVFLASRDRNSQTFSRYLENYNTIADDDLTESIQPERYLSIQADKLFKYLNVQSGERVCEIGIGKGLLLDRLLTVDASITGIDISTEFLRRYRERGVRLMLANAENLPFREEFDLIVASDILEHVLNVGDFLISVYDALRPRGRFVVRVPYKEDLRMYARRNGCAYEFVHLRSFTRSSLKDLLSHAEFRVEKLILDGFFPTRRRRLFATFPPARKAFNATLLFGYGSYNDPPPVANWLGLALMKPAEVTAVVRKQ